MSRPRSIPVEDLALAYELRAEYGMCWKSIARQMGYDHQQLCDAVNHVIVNGLQTS
jgi:hypothetical protein